ncbi:His/Gly/Thr/Pro-type tRNA ligase C-terminal domain-containing protein [Streptomyces sp. NBC_00386]|uniref:His/Gly/Thr/Pro-type tRNA ligase C-terminal domain-containing protein n=1 Tax=Streptomyces sp. NBC_00386 TaxID=2975734 RepID=UPI003FCE4FA1
MALSVSGAETEQVAGLVRRCRDQGIRAELAAPDEGSLGARVRAARLVPHQAAIGPREAAAGLIALRLRDGRRLDPRPADEVLHRAGRRIASRGVDLLDGTGRGRRCAAPHKVEA